MFSARILAIRARRELICWLPAESVKAVFMEVVNESADCSTLLPVRCRCHRTQWLKYEVEE
jgi:hypothetical protein